MGVLVVREGEGGNHGRPKRDTIWEQKSAPRKVVTASLPRRNHPGSLPSALPDHHNCWGRRNVFEKHNILPTVLIILSQWECAEHVGDYYVTTDTTQIRSD